MQETGKDELQTGDERDLLGEALAQIFRTLSQHPLVLGDATASGMGAGVPSARAESPLVPVLPNLYDGLSGTALFLAAYYIATQNSDARDLAVQSAARLRLAMEQIAAETASAPDLETGTGGLAGLATLPYAFTQLASWLRMPELLDSAHEAAMTITPKQILAETRFDVMRGCAGTLLALLSFAEGMAAMGLDSGPAYELALLCGRRLVENRVSYNSGPRAWPAAGSTPLSGFAHGAAGIAYALVRLFQSTGQKEFRDAAMEGFDFERSLYVAELQTWFDPRSNLPSKAASWCEGAPGVALAILGSLIALDSHALRYDLEQALSIVRALPEAPVDHLCCGNFGRIEIMNVAGNLLRRLHLTEYARNMATQIVTRASTSGFHFQPHPYESANLSSREFEISLFLGLSGVGYTLLRLSYPDLFPSILLFESPG